jgi:predicted RNase H-like HicB family nuclease
MAIRYYRALMSLEPDGSCGVVFPELPGCVSHGNDLNDALRVATEALGMHITAMIEDGDAVPPALPVDAPLPEWMVETADDHGIDWSGDVRVLVPVDAPSSVSVKAA